MPHSFFGSIRSCIKYQDKTTIFLVCRPRGENTGEAVFWEELEPQVKKEVLKRVESFRAAGIGGIDLYLASFGPALELFSRHWPVRRGSPKPLPQTRGQAELLAKEFYPYETTPDDVLQTTRAAVKDWSLRQILNIQRQASLDPLLEWFVLAWHTFRSPQFPYDEALNLARVAGVDMERAAQLLEEAEAWDLVILDEAHHARRKGGPGEIPRDAPNQLLKLMRKLCKRAQSLILLTATPMQLHPVEVWDLLQLLGLPESWTAPRFYDMPWNPMRVEQRIGRIDRLGQKHETIKIVNFMYADTVEADIYRALRERISLFGAFVGRLQPILARLPRKFGEIALAGGERSQQIDQALEDMRQEITAGESSGFDIDEMSASALARRKGRLRPMILHTWKIFCATRPCCRPATRQAR